MRGERRHARTLRGRDGDMRWRCVQADDSQAEPARARLARDAFALALVLAAAIVAYRPLLALGHLGWDTYPLILTSRIASAADFLDGFREELMDGRYPHGHFYRPVTTLVLRARSCRLGSRCRSATTSTELGLLLAVHARRRCARPPAARPRRRPAAWRRCSSRCIRSTSRRCRSRRAAPTRSRSSSRCSRSSWRPRRGRAPPRWRTRARARSAPRSPSAPRRSGVDVVPLLFALQLRGVARPALAWARCAPRCAPARSRRSRSGCVLLVRTGVLGGLGGHPELLAARRRRARPRARAALRAPAADAAAARQRPRARARARRRRRRRARRGARCMLRAASRVRVAAARLRRLARSTSLWLNGVSGEIASWYALALAAGLLRCWSAPSRRPRPARAATVAARAPRWAPCSPAC